MPKKFKGENSKAVEARIRKDAQKAADQERLERQKEDELWKDDDKQIAKKQQRKEAKESKRLEQIERKKELQKLHEDEMSSLKGAKAQAQKVTRAQIVEHQEREAAMAAALGTAKKMPEEVPIEENLNRLAEEGDEARTVEDAINILSVNEPAIDRHPEKRMKAAYNAFEETRLPILKQENPNMRLSQLKQMLKKEWMKSPENPLNQQRMAFNS